MPVHGYEGFDWDGLRASRAAPPPAAASDPARRKVYVFALEQAEQMFRAAWTVDAATRPVLIYYGLNQAGRAIAAASSSTGGDWRLAGHGIKARDLEGPIGAVKIFCEPSTNGSFVRLSDLLCSPIWNGRDAVSLADLWDTLPGNWPWPLTPAATVRRLALPFVEYGFDEPDHPLLLAGLKVPFAMLGRKGQRARALHAVMVAYPQAAGYGFVRTGDDLDADPETTVSDDGCWITLTFQVHSDGRSATAVERTAAFRRMAISHGDGLHLVPVLSGHGAPLNPLMAWWAVLYALSMLARYQPAAWGGHIDVDGSPNAVAIERLLRRAMEEVPRLIGDAINQVS